LNKLYEDLKMKKLLIATTALVATAGMAHADVSLSGYAEIGMRDGRTFTNGTDVGVEMHNDMDVAFKLSGATDNGLSFGASIDLDEVSGGIASTGSNTAVFLKSGYGTLTMGDTDGAMDKRNAEVGMLSAIADDHTSHSGYHGGDGGLDTDKQILRYDTSLGNFGISASIAMDESAAGSNDDVTAFGVSTTVSAFTLSVGTQSNDSTDVTMVSAKTSFGGLDMVANFSDREVTGSTATSYDHMAFGLGYTVGDVALSANFGEFSYDDGTSKDGVGISANYGLGGGATVMVGYGSSNSRAKVSIKHCLLCNQYQYLYAHMSFALQK